MDSSLATTRRLIWFEDKTDNRALESDNCFTVVLLVLPADKHVSPQQEPLQDNAPHAFPIPGLGVCSAL